jgi:hypothetical protein
MVRETTPWRKEMKKDGTEKFHAAHDVAAIKKIYEDMVVRLESCMPVNGKAPPNFAVILFYDHDRESYDITSMNANEEEVKDLIMDAFEHLFKEKLSSLVAMVEAKRSTLN